MYLLSLEEVLYIHQAEISLVSHDPRIRDIGLLQSAIENIKLIVENNYETCIFKVASYYIKYISLNHPFIDANKRTALAASLVFLEINGFSIEEKNPEDLANLVLKFIEKEINENDLADYFMKNSINN